MSIFTSESTHLSAELMRHVLGSFCSGVTVLTALDTTGDPVGFTCQSFTALSLNPPLVAFAPARSSTSWPRIRDAGRWCINVLAADQHGLADAFARSGTDKFRGVALTRRPDGPPALDGAVAWIDCEPWAEYDGGDHTLVAASVRALRTDPNREPLLFYRSSYERVDNSARVQARDRR